MSIYESIINDHCIFKLLASTNTYFIYLYFIYEQKSQIREHMSGPEIS
jgi:hypothetical protein